MLPSAFPKIEYRSCIRSCIPRAAAAVQHCFISRPLVWVLPLRDTHPPQECPIVLTMPSWKTTIFVLLIVESTGSLVPPSPLLSGITLLVLSAWRRLKECWSNTGLIYSRIPLYRSLYQYIMQTHVRPQLGSRFPRRTASTPHVALPSFPYIQSQSFIRVG